MPLYTFACDLCGAKLDELRSMERRNDPRGCLCGAEMTRRVEPFRAATFEPYYDEGLGCDISSSKEKRAVMRALGVIESGDRVGGARNFDEKAPHHVSKFTLQGKKFRRERDDGGPIIETVAQDGKTVSRERFGDLPNSA